MDGLDKVKKILIVALVVLMGLNIYAHWYRRVRMHLRP